MACQKWLRNLYQSKWGTKHTSEQKEAIRKRDEANRLKNLAKKKKKGKVTT